MSSLWKRAKPYLPWVLVGVGIAALFMIGGQWIAAGVAGLVAAAASAFRARDARAARLDERSAVQDLADEVRPHLEQQSARHRSEGRRLRGEAQRAKERGARATADISDASSDEMEERTQRDIEALRRQGRLEAILFAVVLASPVGAHASTVVHSFEMVHPRTNAPGRWVSEDYWRIKFGAAAALPDCITARDKFARSSKKFEEAHRATELNLKIALAENADLDQQNRDLRIVANDALRDVEGLRRSRTRWAGSAFAAGVLITGVISVFIVAKAVPP